jgi:hypothetical protein
MRNMGELIPSEQDEAIYAAWQSGKSLRVLAHEFRVSRMEIERAIDRVLPIFDTKSEMRAYKREIHKLEDLGAEFHALAMRDKSPEFAHVTARINERICAMRGWTSVNVRLDPFTAQAEQQPTQYERISEAIMRVVEQAPPAQRALRKRLEQLDPERALALLNGAVDMSPPDDTEPSR